MLKVLNGTWDMGQWDIFASPKPDAESYRNVKNIRFHYKKFAVIKFVVIFAPNMYVHKLNLKKLNL